MVGTFSEMKGIRKVCVIGGCMVEVGEGVYFVKASQAEYLHELAHYFEKVVFVTFLEETERYRTAIDPRLVAVEVLGRARKSAGIASLAKSGSAGLTA